MIYKITSTILIIVLYVSTVSGQEFIIKLDRGNSGMDAEVWSYQTGASNGGERESSNIYTWTRDSETIQKRSLINFDLSGLPDYELFESAELSLFFNPNDQYESFDEHTGENAMFIKRIVTEWEEDTVWWGNQPLATEQNKIETVNSILPDQNYLDLDISPLIYDILLEQDSSFGIMLQMVNEINPYKGCLFASSDHPNSNLHPCLRLNYKIESSVDASNIESIKVLLYPNPTANNSRLNFEIEGVYQEHSVYKLVDIFGNVVQEGEVQNNLGTLVILDIPIGIYFLRIEYMDHIIVERVQIF